MRDDDAETLDQVARLRGRLFLSVISRVELEGGVARDAGQAAVRRSRLDALLDAVAVLDFTSQNAKAYGAIVQACGYSRRKLLDRMIAAQALVHGATLATRNPADFQDVPGLDLLSW